MEQKKNSSKKQCCHFDGAIFDEGKYCEGEIQLRISGTWPVKENIKASDRMYWISPSLRSIEMTRGVKNLERVELLYLRHPRAKLPNQLIS